VAISPLFEDENLAFGRAQVKNSFFRFAVVAMSPATTSAERIADRSPIHHTA